MKKLLSILTILSLLSAGCAGWKTYHTGVYNGKKFKYQSRNIKGFSTNRIEWRIQYGNYKPIYLDAHTLDWGPPYSTDIYAEKAFIIKNDTLKYINDNIQPGNNYINSSMLYIPFKHSEDEAGNAYFDLLNNNWELFNAWFQSSQQSGMPVILGIVQGSKASFTKEFNGTVRGKKMTLHIENDGRVIYESDDKWRQGEYSGLSPVHMPGKILYLKKTMDALTMDEIKLLKDKYNTDPTHYFEIKQTEE